MKKAVMFLALMTVFSSIPAFADGLVFDPETYNANKDTTSATTNKYKTGSYVQPAVDTKKETDITDVTTRQNNNMQNALFELDSAQVDIRNQLLDQKAKYSDIDNQYKLVKDQRKMQKKVVKDSEKRIKQLEKTKEQIRKNMQVQ
jgi:hypothetical protein